MPHIVDGSQPPAGKSPSNDMAIDLSKSEDNDSKSDTSSKSDDTSDSSVVLIDTPKSDTAKMAALKNVWECTYINKGIFNGRKGWKCAWCGCVFHPEHASRVLYHVLGITGHGVAVCQATILAVYMERYRDLFTRKLGRARARKRAADDIAFSIVQGQNSAAASLDSKRASRPRAQPKPAMEVITLPDSPDVSTVTTSALVSSTSNSTSNSTSSNALGFAVLPRRKHARLLNGRREDNQPSVEAALIRAHSRTHSDIRVSNNSKLEMAIADLFHAENISDMIVERPRFQLVLK